MCHLKHITWVRSCWISWWRVNVWENISDPPDDTQTCICEFTCCSCLSNWPIVDSRPLSSSSTFVETNLRYKCIWSSNCASSFLAYMHTKLQKISIEGKLLWLSTLSKEIRKREISIHKPVCVRERKCEREREKFHRQTVKPYITNDHIRSVQVSNIQNCKAERFVCIVLCVVSCVS